MNSEELDVDGIHPSLTAPVLWAGVDRRIIALEFIVAVLLVGWKGVDPTAVLNGLLIIVPLHLVARYVTRTDPRFFDLLVRSLAWARYYPPHAAAHVPAPPVKPSIPGAK